MFTGKIGSQQGFFNVRKTKSIITNYFGAKSFYKTVRIYFQKVFVRYEPTHYLVVPTLNYL